MSGPATPEDPPRGLSSARFAALSAVFAASGGAGLVDQVCFSKYLSYVVGSTAYAVSAVLAAFMTGLALGARFGGALSRRIRRPIVAYGIAEIVVGASVALAPLAFQLLTPAYVAVARGASGSLPVLIALRWLIALLVVVVPTAAMGTTLPLASPAIASDDDPQTRRRRLGVLYAVNTFGGALGALLGAYVVLPTLGLSGTLYAAGAVSAVAGGLAILLGRNVTQAVPVPAAASLAPPTEPEGGPALTPQDVLLAFASGALVFTAEVVATHLLAVIVGNSAYAFGLILAVFLICLFAGALIAPWAARRFGKAALGGSLLLSAFAIALTLPLWDDLPLLFGDLGEKIKTFEGREAMRAAVAFAILCVPVTFMGLTFPLLLQRAARARDVGDHVGRLTAINTVGAVVGAVAAGYLVLPGLGSQGTFVALAVVFAGLAMMEAVRHGRGRVVTGVLAAVASVVALVPKWNIANLTRGTNVYFDGGGAGDEIIFMRDDVHGGITTVTKHENVLTLYTNGKFQGNTGWEMNAQRYFAHYPSIFVNPFDDALVIGLGTGTTLGTLAAYPWKRIQVVEISPAIVEAARAHFRVSNHGVLDSDPRVHLTLDDARNWLLVNDGRFDLISMELSSVWFAGAASLYSREFYALIEQHLKPTGVFQQWVQLHHVEDRVFATMLNTLRMEFKRVALFYGGGQGIIVATNDDLKWSENRAIQWATDPKLMQVLPYQRPLASLTNDILVLDQGLDAYLDAAAQAAGVPRSELVSNDDNLYLEYETPRGNILGWDARERLVERLRTFRDPAAIAALAR